MFYSGAGSTTPSGDFSAETATGETVNSAIKLAKSRY